MARHRCPAGRSGAVGGAIEGLSAWADGAAVGAAARSSARSRRRVEVTRRWSDGCVTTVFRWPARRRRRDGPADSIAGMAPSALSPQESAQQRDAYRQMVDHAVDAGARDVYEYRLGAFDAVNAARWTAAVDPHDPSVVDALRTAGQFGAAVMTSIGATSASHRPIRGRLRVVPPGLPPEAFTARQWADALWAATAAGDAASAVRLARLRSDVGAADGPAGEVDLARAVAAWWRGERVAPHLIAALRAANADDDDAAGVVAAVAAVFRYLLDEDDGGNDGGDDAALRHAVSDAGEEHARYWDAPRRRTDPGRALSLPLSGLLRLAVEQGRRTGAAPPGVPTAGLAAGPTTAVLCPVCASPFDAAESECGWCGTGLTRDAPLDQRLADLLADASRPCPVCERVNRVTALRCWNCHSSLSSPG
jgi:hypothetical protein